MRDPPQNRGGGKPNRPPAPKSLGSVTLIGGRPIKQLMGWRCPLCFDFVDKRRWESVGRKDINTLRLPEGQRGCATSYPSFQIGRPARVAPGPSFPLQHRLQFLSIGNLHKNTPSKILKFVLDFQRRVWYIIIRERERGSHRKEGHHEEQGSVHPQQR